MSKSPLRRAAAAAAVAAVSIWVLVPRPLRAQPSAGICSDLSRAALALCRQYCTRLECNVTESPACSRLRERFEQMTGSSLFPCDAAVCGNGRVEPSEECDPPGSICVAFPVAICGPTCLCAGCPLRCGDGVCGFDEDNCTCPSDCAGEKICFDCVVFIQPPVCGNGVCEGPCVLDGETNERCPQDCPLACPL